MKSVIKLICILFFVQGVLLASEVNDDIIKKNLPKLLATSNMGTEFFLTFHPGWETTNNYCMVYVFSKSETSVTLEIPGKGIKMVKTVSPNKITEFQLDPNDAQCYSKSDREPPKPHKVYDGAGIIVKSEKPIACYGFMRGDYTGEGYEAKPKELLGKKYIVASFNDPCQDNGNQYLTSYTSIIGVYDNTEVLVKLGGRYSNYTPGYNPLKTGDSVKSILQRGDVWLIGVMGDYNDLTGTIINASKRVAVISGSYCAYVPIQISACDYLIEQDMPIESWGKSYHATRLARRLKASILRIFASKPKTTIFRDGSEWAYVNDVGGAEGSGFIERRAVDFFSVDNPSSVTISSSNNIAITQYNPGQSDDGVKSDPFQMGLIPIDSYQNEILFSVPDLNFQNNYINLCLQINDDGSIPESIYLGKAVDSSYTWTKLSDIEGAGYEIFAELIGNKKYATRTLNLENNTTYVIKGEKPLAGYLYGNGNYVSYGLSIAGTYTFNDLINVNLLSPQNMDKSITTSPIFEWEENSEINDYCLKLALDKDFKSVVIDTNINTTTLSLKEPLKKSQTYYWKVSVLDSNMKTIANSETWSFTTASFLLISPDDNANGIDLTPSLKWEEVKTANNYVIEVSKNSDFSDSKIFNSKLPNIKITTNLDYYTKYYWRVKAELNYGKYEYSPTFRFKTIFDLDVALVKPLNNSINIDQNPIFSWEYIKESQGYILQVSKDTNFKNIVINKTFTKNNPNFYQPVDDSLELNTKYYWRISAIMYGTNSKWSEIWSFKTLDKINIILPVNNSKNVPINATLVWEKYEDATQYQIRLVTKGQKEKNIMSQDTIYYCTEPLFGNSLYEFEVRPIIKSDFLAWSNKRVFETADVPIIQLISPQNSDTNVSILPKFDWNDYNNADSYEIQIREKTKILPIAKEVLLSEYIIEEPLNSECTYLWRVRPITQDGYGLWSDLWSFATGNSNSIEDGENVFDIMPNPVKDKLALTTSNNDFFIKRISILNVSGYEILSKQVNSSFSNASNFEMDCSQLASGAYTLLVDIGNKTYIKRFIIER